MKKTIFYQILGPLMIFFIFAVFTFMAVGTKDIIAIIGSIILGIITFLFTLNSIKVIKKEKGKKIKYDFNYTAVICLILILTIFVAFLTLLIQNITYRLNGVETTATVYDIDKETNYKTEYDEDGNPYQKKHEKCNIYIKYEVENKEYKNKLDVGSCRKSIGDEIKIYYDKDNPNDFVSNSIVLFVLATLFTGGCLIIFIVQWVRTKPKKRKVRKYE